MRRRIVDAIVGDSLRIFVKFVARQRDSLYQLVGTAAEGFQRGVAIVHPDLVHFR